MIVGDHSILFDDNIRVEDWGGGGWYLFSSFILLSYLYFVSETQSGSQPALFGAASSLSLQFTGAVQGFVSLLSYPLHHLGKCKIYPSLSRDAIPNKIICCWLLSGLTALRERGLWGR